MEDVGEADSRRSMTLKVNGAASRGERERRELCVCKLSVEDTVSVQVGSTLIKVRVGGAEKYISGVAEKSKTNRKKEPVKPLPPAQAIRLGCRCDNATDVGGGGVWS